MHGRLPGIQGAYVRIILFEMWCMGAYPGVDAYPGHYGIIVLIQSQDL